MNNKRGLKYLSHLFCLYLTFSRSSIVDSNDDTKSMNKSKAVYLKSRVFCTALVKTPFTSTNSIRFNWNHLFLNAIRNRFDYFHRHTVGIEKKHFEIDYLTKLFDDDTNTWNHFTKFIFPVFIHLICLFVIFMSMKIYRT